jgi:hypothetical protein
MFLKLTASISLLENLSLKNWWQDSRGVSVMGGGLKSLRWTTSMIIDFSCRKTIE